MLPTRAELAQLPASRWAGPDDDTAPDEATVLDDLGVDDQGPDDMVAHGADLEPGTLLAAYRAGMFPMPVARRGGPVWWCPVRRAVLDPAALRISRSLRKSSAHYHVTIDTAFVEVVRACATTRRPGGWISDDIATAYLRLHSLGWAHSVETRGPDGDLVGGLYGVAIGGLFAGESMFHDAAAGRDASKAALMRLCALLTETGAGRLVDVQWLTPHLAGLGAAAIARADYLARLPGLLDMPLPRIWR